MDAINLRCPGCGAAVSSDALGCNYCGARLQTVACPKCLAPAFAGNEHCARCGAALVAALPARAGDLCPECGCAMEGMSLGATRVQRCGTCDGLWLHREDFTRICSTEENQTAALAWAVAAPPKAGTPGHVRYRKCPECETLMTRKAFASRAGVVIDVCPNHGVWLDGGELAAIIGFIRAGGLARDRQIEREQLEHDRAALERARGAGDPWAASRTAMGPKLGAIGPLAGAGLADGVVDALFNLFS